MPTPADGAGQEGAAGDRDIRDIALELSFVPKWARQPAARNPYAEHPDEGRGRHDRAPGPRRDDARREGPPGRGPRERGAWQEKGRRGRGDERRRRGEAGPPGGRHGPAPAARERAAPESQYPSPMEVSFIPERDKLSLLVRELQESHRAYRLGELAELFLARPEYHAAKIELRKDEGKNAERFLYQCKATQAVFLDRLAAMEHVKWHGLREYFDAIETETEPPAGHFLFVGRCPMSGTLLGPPNHHSFMEKLQGLHRERFSHMTLEEYRKRIEMVRDPEMVEQWKQEQRKKTVYRRKGEGEEGKAMDRAEAERLLVEERAGDLLQRGTRFIVSSAVLRNAEDPEIRRAVSAAWRREMQRPFTIIRALRPALRHMRFHIFRANGRTAFVTAVKPRPLAADHTVETIGEVLGFLHDHAGCTRQEMIAQLRPGKEPESPEVGEVLHPLRWLVEKGHVIEFWDGTLSVPSAALSPPVAAPAGAAATSSPQES